MNKGQLCRRRIKGREICAFHLGRLTGIEKLQDRLGMLCNAACNTPSSTWGLAFAGKAHALGPILLKDGTSWGAGDQDLGGGVIRAATNDVLVTQEG